LSVRALVPRKRCRLVHGAGDWKQVIDLGHLEKLENPRAHPGGGELNALVLAADEVPHDQTETAGIHIRHIREIEDIHVRRVSRRGFRLKEVLQSCGRERGIHVPGGKRPGESEDERAGHLPLRAFDVEAGAFPDLGGCSGHRVSLLLAVLLREVRQGAVKRIVTVRRWKWQGQKRRHNAVLLSPV